MLNTLTRLLGVRLTVFLIVLGSTLTIALGHANRFEYPISIIPQPRDLNKHGARFILNRKTRIVLADPRSADDQFAANDFVNDLKETADVTLRTGGSRGRNTILIGLLSSPVIQSALESTKLSLPATLNEEGYVL